ncbi:MAG: diacylglycerol kinase family protein [Longimicrobiales bacterium]
MPRRAFVVFNPASGRGRGARLMERYLSLLETHLPGFRHGITTRPGEESVLAEQALQDGFELIVAVGGDGTWGSVADRIIAAGRKDVALGILAAGTGNDFGRNFGLPDRTPEDAVRTLADGRVVRVDAGLVTSEGWRTAADPETPGATGPRYFVNVVGFGFDVAVIEAIRGARFLSGELLYKVAALRQLFTYRAVPLRLTPEREPGIDGRYLMVTISNGPVFGGSIPIAPAAELADGMLDACAIGDANALARASLFRQASTGRHVLSPEVHSRRDTRFVLSFESAPKYEVDGDVWQAEGREVVIEVAPNALSIVVPA